MIQVKLAVLFNDSFCMERLHNAKNVIRVLRFDKRGKGSRQGKRIRILRVTRPALINTAALARCHGWSATFLTVSNGFPSDGKPLKRLDFALRLLDTGLKPRC